MQAINININKQLTKTTIARKHLVINRLAILLSSRTTTIPYVEVLILLNSIIVSKPFQHPTA